jgi:very-short-patch-repair endonuclease
LTEFGPQSIIYHEGSTYRVRKAVLGIKDTEIGETSIRMPVQMARLCPACGYGHFGAQRGAERCVNCDESMDGGRALQGLYRIEQVSTRRATRITSDEEERQRQGYETVTTFRYADVQGRISMTSLRLMDGEQPLLELQYGPAATVWKINLGWRRRRETSVYGFNINVSNGVWSKDDQAPDEVNGVLEPARSIQRVIPYVEDRRNILLVRPHVQLERNVMVTLQYALKRGIEAAFQLEESDLAVELLPERNAPQTILLYESAEGGAGVLTRLVTDLDAVHRMARHTLEIMHFPVDPGAGGLPVNVDPLCGAGCYRCLLGYGNQLDHDRIDRRDLSVLGLLVQLTRCQSVRGYAGHSTEEHIQTLVNSSLSSLEQAWLDYLKRHGFRLPDRAQPLLEAYGTQPDFAYSSDQALIYIDGPHHDHDRQRQLDGTLTRRLQDAGMTVIRFPKETSAWDGIVRQYGFIFGQGNP